MFNEKDFIEHDFFKFGRACLSNGELSYAPQAMYDISSPLEVHPYDWEDKKSKPSILRPSFKRALSFLSSYQQDVLSAKLNNFIQHLHATEGSDYFNAFVIACPDAIGVHTHAVVFEQTYVCSFGDYPISTSFVMGKDMDKSFNFPKEDFYVKLWGNDVPHRVDSTDKNIKFYFVFEYNRPCITNSPFERSLYVSN